MKFTATILSLAVATLALVEAAPSPAGHAVPLVRNENHKKNFRAQIAKLSHRYPELKLNRNSIINAAAGGSGKVSLTDVGPDSEYYGQVMVGSPPQKILLDFDTGSSDIWFPTSTCTTTACKAHHRFNTGKSSTYKKDGRTWQIAYGDKSTASGILGSDIVSVGGVKVRQTIGLATQESAQFARSPQDGLFGLGFNTIESVQGVKTFMDNAISSKALALPVVSVFLPSVRRNGGKGGNFLFGAIDHTRYTGALTYVPVTRKGYWQVAIQGLSFNTKSLGQASEGIVDTGTTLIILGDAAAAAVHKNIKGAVNSAQDGGWLVPCSLTTSKDTISFKMGGKNFQVPLADLAWDPISTGSTTCFSGVQGGQNDLWILGDVFIKNNYCVFDQSSTPSIGIAPLKY
ncbi:aspartic proteinase IV [Dissophora ornata]|nr:Type I transmembrane sorting receptor [Dissophora ornata]KAI8602943.1 aspartic proteinase IV [Dissophora ornata]